MASQHAKGQARRAMGTIEWQASYVDATKASIKKHQQINKVRTMRWIIGETPTE